ncbi:DNA replication and repair protein RecN [Tamaricihabitans halophyticus]|uniref:DNA repair protein RecN n=2 Tax=Tamaricihabitans halophyticus TaxID=1262583 RepID=A0A4R2PTH7_9PSEU|nr:DNA replication and repair protein RecN [Tamaricihabitans halophyticus]
MRIQGLGVIDEAVLELHPGFTVVTGETGAGKTMVVTGLHLLSGGRADASRVRNGASRAVVEGRFAIGADSPAHEVAADAGAEADEDGSVIAVRTVSADGRSRAHVGGRSAPVGVLSELAEQLLAVHGQNDQLRLLRPGEQRAVLDRFAGPAVGDPLAEYRRVRHAWLEVTAELTERTERAREMAMQADLLRHGLDEIEAVAPEPNEDVELTKQARRLADVDELRSAASEAEQAIAGSSEGDPEAPGALGLLSEARRRLTGVADDTLRELEPRLAEASMLLGEIGTELAGYVASLEADPELLERVLARQAELKKLTRKYAADVDGVLAWAKDANQQLAKLDTSEEALAELANRKQELETELTEHAIRVSAAREQAAAELGKAISEELSGLAMGEATIEISVATHPAEQRDPHALQVHNQLVHAGADGVDDVELRLCAHSGGVPMPVHKAASGGELSRVMLAIEVVLAHADTTPTLVFDEVDAGVGGRAAVEVGRRLAKLARSHQVLVVTHLPQVAAYADQHLVVDKSAEGGVTSSGVRVLKDSERVVELARMLAGMEGTKTGRAHAEELRAAAEKDKKGDRNGGRKRKRR